MYTYGKEYFDKLMNKQGELSPVPDGVLHREKHDAVIAGPMDRDELQVDMGRKANPDNKVDPAVFAMADQKDY
tara:strand:- start:4338 stop:4556 length:219 start_codon:yes stop_codon:yes gene_type:complete